MAAGILFLQLNVHHSHTDTKMSFILIIRGCTCTRSIPPRTFLTGSVEAANEQQIHSEENFSSSHEPLRAEIHRVGCFMRSLLQFAISIGQCSFVLTHFSGINRHSYLFCELLAFSFFKRNLQLFKGRNYGFHIYQRPTKFKFKINILLRHLSHFLTLTTSRSHCFPLEKNYHFLF